MYHCAVMPCYDKKLEAARDDFALLSGPGTGSSGSGRPVPETDCVLATTELWQLLAVRGLDLRALAPQPFDPPYTCQVSAGAAATAEAGSGGAAAGSQQQQQAAPASYGVAGGSGGYLEAAMRAAAEALFHAPLPPGRLDVVQVRTWEGLGGWVGGEGGGSWAGWRGAAARHSALAPAHLVAPSPTRRPAVAQGRNPDLREWQLELGGRTVLRGAIAYGFRCAAGRRRRPELPRLSLSAPAPFQRTPAAPASRAAHAPLPPPSFELPCTPGPCPGRNIQGLVRKMKLGRCDYDYVEVMACPSGERARAEKGESGPSRGGRAKDLARTPRSPGPSCTAAAP